MKSKDFNAEFERLKKFKEENSNATDGDEFFKALYTRYRKYVKKWNKMNDKQGKIQKDKEMSKEQKDTQNKKKELENSLEEIVYLIDQFLTNYENHCQQIVESCKVEEPAPTPEEVKEEVEELDQVEEPQPEPEEKEPPIDVEAIRKEEYDRGYDEGRATGYKEGEDEGYKAGKQDGIEQAKSELESEVKQNSEEDTERAANYFSLINTMGYWVNTYPMVFNPPFKRNDYFTEDE